MGVVFIRLSAFPSSMHCERSRRLLSVSISAPASWGERPRLHARLDTPRFRRDAQASSGLMKSSNIIRCFLPSHGLEACPLESAKWACGRRPQQGWWFIRHDATLPFRKPLQTFMCFPGKQGVLFVFNGTR